MSHRLRLATIGLFVLGLALASAWLGAFAMRNSQLIVLRVPEPRLDLAAPLETVIWESQASWLVLGAFLSGSVAMIFALVLPLALRRGYQRHRDRRLIRQLEHELADLRNLPILSPAPLEDLEADPEPSGSVDAEPAVEAEPASSSPPHGALSR